MKKSISGYGVDYELAIGPSKAKELLGNLNQGDLPKMGYEVILKKKVDGAVLSLQNVSGQLVLASISHETNKWEDVFGVSL